MDPLRTDQAQGSPAEGALEEADSRISRRRLIQSMGVVGGAALAGASAAIVPEVTAAFQEATPEATDAATGIPPEVPPWMKEWGPLPSEYGSRSPFEDCPSRTRPHARRRHCQKGDIPERRHRGLGAGKCPRRSRPRRRPGPGSRVSRALRHRHRAGRGESSRSPRIRPPAAQSRRNRTPAKRVRD